MNELDILSNVIDNALLHLYLTVTETTRYTPIPKRNEILVRYLKPLAKDIAYRKAKKEIQSFLRLARRPGCNLESKLVELHELSLEYDKSASGARRLFDALSLVEDKLGLPTQFIHVLNGQQPQPDTIYMLQEHIENGFIESGEQVAPVSLFLESSKVDDVQALINESGLFQAELQQMNEGAKQGHIVLHPTTKEG